MKPSAFNVEQFGVPFKNLEFGDTFFLDDVASGELYMKIENAHGYENSINIETLNLKRMADNDICVVFDVETVYESRMTYKGMRNLS